MIMARRHAGEDAPLAIPAERATWRRVARARGTRVHYGWQTLSGELIAFCQTRTGTVMHAPKLESVSWRVNCKLCRHHLGMQGAPIP